MSSEEAAPPDGDNSKVEERPEYSDIKKGSSGPRVEPTKESRGWHVLKPIVKWRQKIKESFPDPMVRATIIGATATLIGATVALIGVIVALIGVYLVQSAHSVDRQIQDQGRFNTLIQELANVRARMTELTLKYGDKAPALNVDLGQPLIEEAYKLLLVKNELVENKKLVENKGVDANSYQRTVLAQSLNEANQPYRAERLADQAMRAAEESGNLLEEVTAARVLAVALFNQGNSEDGRQKYKRALDYVENPPVVEKLPVKITPVKIYEPIKAQYRIEILQSWISSELRIKDCARAKERILDLDSNIKSLPEVLSSLRTNAQRLRDYVANMPCR